MGKASFGGSQDLSNLFARIGAGQGDAVVDTKPKTATEKATYKNYVLKPQKIKMPSGTGGSAGIEAQLAELSLKLTKGEIDEFEYAAQEEALANTLSDASDRAQLLEHAYKVRASAISAQDSKFSDGWKAGEVSDQEYLDYLQARLENEDDPDEKEALAVSVKGVADYIGDAQAVRAWKAGGPIQNLVAHYKRRMDSYPVDSQQHRVLEEEYWSYLDEMQNGQYEALKIDLVNRMNKGEIDEAGYLREIRKFRSTLRPGSKYAASMDDQIRKVADEVASGNKYRQDVKMERDFKAGKISRATYRAYIEKDALKYKYSDPERYAKMMALARGVSTGSTGGSGGGSGGGGGSSTTYKANSPSGIEGMTIAEALKEIRSVNPSVPSAFKNKTAAGQFITKLKNQNTKWQAIVDAAATQGIGSRVLVPDPKTGKMVSITVTEKLVNQAVKEGSKLFKTITGLQLTYKYVATQTTDDFNNFLTKASNFHTPDKDTVNIYRDQLQDRIEQAGTNPDPAEGAAEIQRAIKDYTTQYQNQYSKLTTAEQSAKKLGATAQNDLRHNRDEWQDTRSLKAPGMGANMDSPVMQQWTQDIADIQEIANAVGNGTMRAGMEGPEGTIRYSLAASLANNTMIAEGSGYVVVQPDGKLKVVLPAADGKGPEPPKAPNGATGSYMRVIMETAPGRFATVLAPVTETKMGLKYAELKYSDNINGVSRNGRITSDELAAWLKQKKLTLDQAIDQELIYVKTDQDMTSKMVTVGGVTYVSNPLTNGWVTEDRAWKAASDFGLRDGNSNPENDLQSGMVVWTRDVNGNFLPRVPGIYATGAGELPVPVFTDDPAGAQAYYNANRQLFMDPSTTMRTYDLYGRVAPTGMPEDYYLHAVEDALSPARPPDERGRVAPIPVDTNPDFANFASGLGPVPVDTNPDFPAFARNLNQTGYARIQAAINRDKRRAAMFGDAIDRKAAEAGVDKDQQALDLVTGMAEKIQGTLAGAFGLGSSAKTGEEREAVTYTAAGFAIKNRDLPPVPAKSTFPPNKSTADRVIIKLPSTFTGPDSSAKAIDLPALPGTKGLLAAPTYKGNVGTKTLSPITMPSSKESKITKPKPIVVPKITAPKSQAKANVTAQKVQNSGKSAKIGPTTKVAS